MHIKVSQIFLLVETNGYAHIDEKIKTMEEKTRGSTRISFPSFSSLMCLADVRRARSYAKQIACASAMCFFFLLVRLKRDASSCYFLFGGNVPPTSVSYSYVSCSKASLVCRCFIVAGLMVPNGSSGRRAQPNSILHHSSAIRKIVNGG